MRTINDAQINNSTLHNAELTGITITGAITTQSKFDDSTANNVVVNESF